MSDILVPASKREARKADGISLKNREVLSVEGVCEVVSFDEGAILLETEGGRLTIEGEGLHIKKLLLELGEAHITGRISALFYSDRNEGKRGGFFGRLFGA